MKRVGKARLLAGVWVFVVVVSIHADVPEPPEHLADAIADALPEVSTALAASRVKAKRKTAEFPRPSGVIAAAHYLSRRAGTAAFAVYDNKHKTAGLNTRLRFHTASVVKSMLLVAYLQTLAAEHRKLDSESTGLLYPMIHSSDNDDASAIFAIVGESGLERVARESKMNDFEPRPPGDSPRSQRPIWLTSSTSRTA